MSDYLHLELNARNLRMEIENYSREHPNDFGIPDGKERIPMKKLMKLFAIKKKTPAGQQNLFRQLVNDHCELEIKEGIGKVLVLIECDDYESSDDEYGDSDDDELDYGYEEAAPSDFEVNLKSESDYDDENDNDISRSARPSRFRAPPHTASGGLSVATAESIGVYDRENGGARRTGYRRRGSVTRYSVVGADAVVAEYKKHEEMINQFRRDSLKLERSIRNLNLGSGSNHSTASQSQSRDSKGANSDQASNFESGSGSTPEKMISPQQHVKKRKEGAVKKLLRRSRFSLAF